MSRFHVLALVGIWRLYVAQRLRQNGLLLIAWLTIIGVEFAAGDLASRYYNARSLPEQNFEENPIRAW